MVEQSHSLGLLQRGGDGGGFLGDVRDEQGRNTGKSLRCVWGLLCTPVKMMLSGYLEFRV